MTKSVSLQGKGRISDGLVYLMYHEIELAGRALCQSQPGYVRYIVTESDFRNHLSHLKNNDWTGMSVEQALSSPRAPGVVFTFDDGCETDLITVAPLLKEAGFGGTFYITVGFLGQRGYLSPPQVRGLSDLGFDVGCHSMNHTYLSDLATEVLQKEIAVPKEVLEQITGREVAHFSCPGGRFDARVIQAAREAGFRSLATSQAIRNTSRTDPFALGRVVIMRGTAIEPFWRTCQGQGLWRKRWNDQARATVKTLIGNSIYDRFRGLLLREEPSGRAKSGQ
jgi:peptidoglycan/xylan/chitin deacetylase (PgdA/CDA1 family)